MTGGQVGGIIMFLVFCAIVIQNNWDKERETNCRTCGKLKEMK
jgi:hypothetical protein